MTTSTTTSTLRRRVVPSPVGPLTLIASDAGLRAVLWLDDAPGRVPFAAAPVDDDDDEDPVLSAAAGQLEEWFAGRRRAFDLALDPAGTPFQHQVWDELARVSFGQTTTYGELAEEATGDRRKARAVGAAVGRNPLSIVVPCHRVIGANGTLTGFAGGLDVKRHLLDHEAGAPPLDLGLAPAT